jgi:glycosyltransferase involved in cell wall biosynthesis
MRFSIITPVYNGDTFLPPFYEHLKQHFLRFPDFEWIIVDDCSIDNTIKTINYILESEPSFQIRAIYLDKNTYASGCVQNASLIAQGDYTIVLDVDDFLSDDALFIFTSLIDKYQHHSDFAGVCGRCVDFDENFIGTPFVDEEVYANELYVRHILRIKGEMFQCTKTNLVREYFQGMKPGYTNGWAWSRISLKYSWIYTNKIVRRYFTQNPQSVTHSPTIRYIYNRMLMDVKYMSTMRNYIRYDIKYWVRRALVVATGSWLCKKMYIGYKQPWFVQLILLAFIPMGGLIALGAIIINGRKKYSIHS